MKTNHRKKRDYIYYDLTQGMCRKCRKIIDAQIIFRDNRVFLKSICPAHGVNEAVIASDVKWYLNTINSPQVTDKPRYISKKLSKNCPFDCGLCSWHEKACNLPVFSITNACNLECPICFTYNRKDEKYFMTEEEFRKIIDGIVDSEGSVDLINITGGEPTLHPNLFKLLQLCQRKEIGRVTLNSNGIVLAKDEDIVKRLADIGLYVILSFNTMDRDISKKMHNVDLVDIKFNALENLKKYDVQTTLLNVSTKNLNDREIGDIVTLALREDFIRSVTVQNMTYTGCGGGEFLPREHITIDDVIANIIASHKELKIDDFTTLPGSHPLCYSICYMFYDGNILLPLKRLFSDEEYYAILGKKYLIHPDTGFQAILTEKINHIWSAKEKYPDAEKTLALMKKFISMLYPAGKNLTDFERQRIAERFIKTIYIHSHMDEDNFDVSRVVRCGDLVPDVNKTFIPACTYNLFYRMKDERFWKEANI